MGAAVDQERRLAAHRYAVWQLALDAALVEVVRAFAGGGVSYLLLKGRAFAQWLYDDPRERFYRDLDLLVGPGDHEPARAKLAALGFEQHHGRVQFSDEETHHQTWVRRGAAIELHHGLYGVPAPSALLWARLAQGAETIEVRGAQVSVPSEPASAMIVALHAAQHGLQNENTMLDLRRALERVDFDTWVAATALSRELGAEGQFAAGLWLAPAGRELLGPLGLPTTPSRELRLLVSAAPPGAAGLERWLATDGIAARLALLARKLVPSPERMRRTYPIARRSRWGLALAYLCRPVWLGTKAPRAAGAWLRAARR